jgi:alcohol dehydrogenase
MRAFVLTGYGGPEKAEFRDLERPLPDRAEVLVRVQAAGLNPIDYKTRQGMLKLVQRYPLPIVMGNELAGIVEAVGPDVVGFTEGDRVFARMPKDRMGAFAEYAVVPQDLLAKMPDPVDFKTAGGVPLAGLTALQALRGELALAPGSRVLITGGAGGVGTFAIQIAKWLGAEVTTTASPRGRALVERLGADVVIDYTTEELDQHVGFDAAFDLVGGDTLDKAFGTVRRGGTVLSIAGTPEPRTARRDLGRGTVLAALFWLASYRLRARARRHGAAYRFLLMHPSGAELAELAELVLSGDLEPIIDRVFPFDDIAEAFAYLQSGRAKGKVVVTM